MVAEAVLLRVCVETKSKEVYDRVCVVSRGCWRLCLEVECGNMRGGCVAKPGLLSEVVAGCASDLVRAGGGDELGVDAEEDVEKEEVEMEV